MLAKYAKLTEHEIKTLVVENKWFVSIRIVIEGEVQRLTQRLVVRVKELEERYARPLPEIERDVDMLSSKVEAHLTSIILELLTGSNRLPGFDGCSESSPIGAIAEVKTGPFGSALHERDYVAEGTPIITVEHLGERGVLHVNIPKVSDADRTRLRAYSLNAGDIVFSRVGSIDRNALIRDREAGWLFSGRLLRLRPNPARALSSYLSYYFHSEQFRRRIREVAVGQTMASLNTRILQEAEVVLPSLSEQDAIAEVLSDIDAELTALEAHRDKMRAIKKAIMQQILADLRLMKPQPAEAEA